MVGEAVGEAAEHVRPGGMPIAAPVELHRVYAIGRVVGYPVPKPPRMGSLAGKPIRFVVGRYDWCERW